MMTMLFSSRRRHTRLQGDWSSDVCSSDLGERDGGETEVKGVRKATSRRRALRPGRDLDQGRALQRRSATGRADAGRAGGAGRSEERRVGEGGGGRWCAGQGRRTARWTEWE